MKGQMSTDQVVRGAGPLRPSPAARVALRPADLAHIDGGFWAARRQTNALVSITEGPQRLEEAGNLGNLRRAAEGSGFAGDFQFQDSDVYKWLEAACWQLADPGLAADVADELVQHIAKVSTLIAAAQEPDGYLQTYYQLGGGERWSELGWGHELYCAGHLIQAAIAHRRATRSDDLLDVARAFADRIDTVFGPGRAVDGVCGHPQIETALVELYRETGERRYLTLATYFVDRRGTGTLAGGVDRGHDRDPGAAFWQDHVPVRSATAVAGHAVRQLYLLAGAADVAAETGDAELGDAVERLWQDMAATKTYLTGGVGSRFDWESFGEPYELPSDRAYAETCAAIASIQLSWRLAFTTGHARYSDLIERTLYNGFLSGVGLDGERWLYVNPLHVRESYHARPGDQGARRSAWFRCACCPPNAMRLLASLPSYFASADEHGLQLHQYASGRYAQGDAAVVVETAYPWQGRIGVTVEQAPDSEWTLSMRIPEWCDSWSVALDGAGDVGGVEEDGWLRIRREWHRGDTMTLDLDIRPRLTEPDPRIDAVRGCVAIEYGPLVYCLEQADQLTDVPLDELALDTTRPLAASHDPDLLGGVTTITAAAVTLPSPTRGTWPTGSGSARQGPAETLTVTAVPYCVWGNRASGAMRVWMPVAE